MEIGYAQILGFIATCMEYNSFVVQLISNPEIIKLEKIALNLNLPKSVGPTKPSSHGYQHRKFLGIEEFAHSIRRTTEFNIFLDAYGDISNGGCRKYLVESSQFLTFESAQVECLYFSKKSGIEPLAIATQHNANK